MPSKNNNALLNRYTLGFGTTYPSGPPGRVHTRLSRWVRIIYCVLICSQDCRVSLIPLLSGSWVFFRFLFRHHALSFIFSITAKEHMYYTIFVTLYSFLIFLLLQNYLMFTALQQSNAELYQIIFF